MTDELSSAEHPRKTVLITGGAKRVGRGIARDLARHGWCVGVHYNGSGGDAEALVEVLRADGAPDAAAVQADLGDPAATAQLIPNAVARLGQLNLLVNNASLFLDDHPSEFDLALWDRHQAINLRAPVMLASAFAAQVPANAHGLVVNMIDQRVLRPDPTFFSYAVSKAALWNATRMLAQGLAPRVRVNGVAPGPVLQSIHQTAEDFAAECASTLLKRGTTPEEIARTIRFLLDAPAVTGQMLALDGGQHLAWDTTDTKAAQET